MKISDLIALLQAALKDGDRPVLLEVDTWSVPMVGSFEGNVRDASEALVLTAEQCDTPEWIP